MTAVNFLATGSAPVAFINTGTFTAASSTAITFASGVAFNSTGLVAVHQGGQVALNGGGTSSGSFTVGTGAELDMTGMQVSLPDASQIDNAGFLNLSGVSITGSGQFTNEAGAGIDHREHEYRHQHGYRKRSSTIPARCIW